MAKLKAPLMSLGASGKLGDALVFFGWKGLDVVREYVIPTNPKSTAQQIQRGYLRTAVENIHGAQGLIPDALDADDQTAYALLGSTRATPRTWFNTIVKQFIDLFVAGETPIMFCNGTPDLSTTLEISFTGKLYGALTVTGKLFYGLTKTALSKWVAADATVGAIDCTITPTVKGTKYFMQWRVDAGQGNDGMRSGIYTGISI